MRDEFLRSVIVINFSVPFVFLGERNVIIEIEIVPVRRKPFETPAHSFLIGLNFGQRCARDNDEGHVAMREMPVCAVKVVSEIRTAFASLFPPRAKHEMIDDQLTATVKEIGQGFPAIWAVEDIFLVDLNPWQ